MTDLRPFVDALAAALGEQLVGVYLHGSLAMGGYRPDRSDVDVLVVVDGRLAPARRDAVGRVCAASGLRVELSVVTATDVATPKHPVPFEVHWGDAGLVDAGRDPDLAAHLTAVRARGVVLHGPPIEDTFGPVPWADFLDAITGDLDWIVDRGLFAADPVYAVLNACRILATLQAPEGTVMSKDEGGEWALNHLPPRHRAVVAHALAVRRDGVEPDWDRDALAAFGRFAVGASVSRRPGRRVAGLP